ncbi:MAG: preprotein translocase subunit SecA [Micromonosporaceae bacterium]|nr:preprotein translocase subunit SecA [Micromonosporaceae bacterium]
MVADVRVSERLTVGFQRFLHPQKTVDLQPFQSLLSDAAVYGERLTGLSDAELAATAAVLREEDPVGPGAGGAGGLRAADSGRTTLAAVCALAREAAVRGLGERPFDVQLLGAMALLSGHVAEMATGEGKTLTAAVAAFGYALGGEPVHILTVNDYLARRDAEWMMPVYERLGVSVGWVGESSTPAERREAYSRDVTYVSVSEAGYDYLRDQLCSNRADAVQRGLATVIVDEADSILIDEARVQLILAGARGGDPDLPRSATRLVHDLRPGRHYEVAEDGRNVELTGAGAAVAEARLGGIDLYAPQNLEWLNAVNVALYAQMLLRRDVEYIVRGGKVDLVDDYRGRVAQRRRWPDGLQAAVEAKEGLDTTAEGEVLATITVQALIGLYRTTCGMTATGAVVGDQLREFYQLNVAVIQSNTPGIRVDEPDRVYASRDQKEAALIAEVAAAHAVGRPVLIGALDVAQSERLAARLRATGVACMVLNAKNDAEEAAIIADAGAVGTVTVSTQMAGRGIDIRLGGSAGRDQVAELGGLYVIGSGRHDSRRVDDQLRGRAGRQGDPGGSVFFVSLDDELVTRHGRDALPPLRAVGPDGRIGDEAVNRAVEHAQRVAEGILFEIHRNTWRYNLFIEHQRRFLATRRHKLLTTDAAAQLLSQRSPVRYAEACQAVGAEIVGDAARSIALFHLDRRWADHLAYLAEVREGVNLRAMAHLDPVDEFHRATVSAFTRLVSEVDDRTVATFDEVEITGLEWNIADAGLVRPTATWTYVVHDNPFGSQFEVGAAFARWAFGRR